MSTTTSDTRRSFMSITFGDLCLAAIAIAVWLIFLFGTNVA